jgi:hypothetical protein
MFGLTKSIRRLIRNRKGFGLVEVVVSGGILSLSLAALYGVQHGASFALQQQRGIGDVNSEMGMQLNFMANIVRAFGSGPSDFLRQYATASSALSNYDPKLDTDPNQFFATMFLPQLSASQQAYQANLTYQINYVLSVHRALFNDPTTSPTDCSGDTQVFGVPLNHFQDFTILFPSATNPQDPLHSPALQCSLHQASAIVITATAIVMPAGTTGGSSNVVIPVP